MITMCERVYLPMSGTWLHLSTGSDGVRNICSGGVYGNATTWDIGGAVLDNDLMFVNEMDVDMYVVPVRVYHDIEGYEVDYIPVFMDSYEWYLMND